MPRTTRTTPLSALALVGLAACSSLIGVQEPSDGTGGASSSGGTSGTGAAEGSGSSSSATGATTGDGGAMSGVGAAPGTGGTGSPTGGAGGEPEGAGGSGGATASTTVTGRIVDMYDRPMAGVPVSVLGGPTMLTDSQGGFSAQDVPGTYDVEFTYSARDGHYTRVYRFVGLTRRDPTLQVDRDVGEQEGRIDVTTANLPAPGVGFLGGTVGSPVDIYFSGDEAGSSGSVGMDYDGQDPFPATLHALLWENAGLDSEYYGLSSKSFAFNNASTTNVLLDTWEPVTDISQLSGLIQAAGANPDVEVTAYLNFPDGAGIPMNTVPWNSSTGSFAIDVPAFDVAVSYSVLACARDTGYACAHKDGFALNGTATNIQLAIPSRVTLLEPLDGTENVGADTIFRWQKASDAPCSLVVINEGQWDYGLRVITCETELVIGSDLVGSFFEYGVEDYWSVQTYGAYQSVDEMAGPNGFFDPYYDGMHPGTLPRGKNRPVEGSLTRSEYHMIRFAE